LFDHQRVAMDALGFRHLTERAERGLTAYLRRSVEATFSGDSLIRLAKVWLYGRSYVLPGGKRIRLLVGAALRHAENALCRRIATKFDSQTVAARIKKLTAPREGTVTVLEWLRDPPHRVGRRDIADHVERAETLRELGSD
jgi:hypothetical protein